uniref:Uncharacterized protein n=1 Tax=Timema bartmani TaxID=61472 RepID=A0A7R9I6P2_9NEOP|nr:unnamed protein product [Timema bartmani]
MKKNEGSDVTLTEVVMMTQDEEWVRLGKITTGTNIVDQELATCGVLYVTGEPLIRRSDDNVDALKKRLETYHKITKPLSDYYSLKGILYRIDAAKSASDVFNNIDKIFCAASAHKSYQDKMKI